MSLEALWELISTKIYPAFLVVFFFGLTIFIHELGHFWMARRKGMKVERFSIGFGPKIFGWKKDGIEYRVSWIPFGGYVALPQMSPMEAIEGKNESTAADLPPAPPSAKIAVAFAGPIMNILLAIVLSYLVWWIGLPVPVNPSIVGYVEPGSREEQLGIQEGDKIVKVNGQPVETWMQVQRIVFLSREPLVTLEIERNGETEEYRLESKIEPTIRLKVINLYSQGQPAAADIVPGSPAEAAGVQVDDEFLAVDGIPVATQKELIDLIKVKPDQPIQLKIKRADEVLTLTAIPKPNDKGEGLIGVQLTEKFAYKMERPGPTPIEQFRDIFRMMIDTFQALVHSKETGVGAHSLSGPLGIGGLWWQEIVNGGIMRGVWFAVLLNLNLAIINLLPLPVLDGGHIVFALLEAIRRKPLNARLVQNLSLAFAFLIIGFMLYITFFDFQKFFGRRRSIEPATNQTPAEVERTSEPQPTTAP